MKVFSNSGPLMALSKLGQLELLSKLYGQVYLSTVVYQEVVVRGRQLGYSDAYLLQMAVHRDQLVVLETTEADLPSEISSLPLDAGEKTTIYLALSNPDSLVLLDDLNAREEAKTRGLKVKGTLGVIVQAYRRNLLPLDQVEIIFEAIISNDKIWIADELCHQVLKGLRPEN